MPTSSWFTLAGMAVCLCAPIAGQPVTDGSQQPAQSVESRVQVAGAKLPATVRWLYPNPETLLDTGRIYVPRVETSQTDAPVTISLLAGPATLTDSELVATGAGKITLRVQQEANASFLPLDAQFVFTAAKRQASTLAWLNPQRYERLQIGQPYPLQVRTSQSDVPVTFTLLDGPATLSGSVLTLTNGGQARIKIEQLGNSLFLPLATNWTFTAGTNPNVTWLTPTNSILAMGQTYTLKVQTSHLEAPILFSLYDGSAILQGNQLTPTGPGPIRVWVSQAGNQTFYTATDIHSFQAVAQTQTVAWQAPLEPSLSLHTPFALSAQSSAGLDVTFRVERGPARVDNQQLILTNFGTVSVVAEQQGTSTILPALSRRSFNAEEIVLARGAWPGFGRASQGESLQLVDDKLYLAGGIGGLVVLDLSKSMQPQRMASYNTPGFVYGVFVDDKRAYLTDDKAGLVICDVSNPALPTLLGGVQTAGIAVGVFVTNHVAFVGAWSAGMQIFDVADPTAPKLLSTTRTGGNAGWLKVVNGTAYVATGTGGLEIYNVVNPAEPTRLASFSTGGQAFGIDLAGDLAYVADINAGLVVLDVRNPAKPIKLARLNSPSAGQVRVVGDRAYLATDDNGLLILDVSNPSELRLIDQRNTSGSVYDVRVRGDKAYVATELSGLDVEDLTAPSGAIINLTGWSRELQIDGNRAYVADYLGGLKTLDVADRDNLHLLGSTSLGGITMSVALAGRYAYLAKGSSGVQVLDLSDPLNPGQGSYLNVGGYVSAVRVQGQRAFVAAGDVGLVVLDLSKPDAPGVISTMGTAAAGGFAGCLEVVGNTAYLAGFEGLGFQILEISNPASPKQIGAYKYKQPANFEGFFIAGKYAYLANQDAGIEILDISDPAHPSLVGLFDTDGTAMGIEVIGDLAYVADYANGLLILDLSDPTAPTLLERFATPGHALNFRAIGNTGYILDGAWGLQVVDLRPRTPQQINFNMARDLLTTDFPLLLGASANSGLPILYQVLSGPATLTGNQLTLTGPGTVIVRAQQPGNDQFLPSSLERTLTISLPRQSITWLSPTNQFLDLGQPQLLQAEASSGLPIGFRVEAGPASIAGATVTVTNTGTVRIVAEQAGNAAYASAKFTRTFNVSAFALAGGGSTNNGALAVWPGPRRGQAVEVRVVGHLAYVAAGALRILDVSQPEQPLELGSYDLSGPAAAVDIEGNLAYVALGYDGLRIVDVSNPAAPRPMGAYQDYQGYFSISDVAVVGTFAYLAGSDGLHIVDVKDPSLPVRAGLYRMSVSVRAVRAVGNRVYVAAGTAGLFIVDVTDPQSPVLLGSYDTPGTATGLSVAGNFAYVADQTAGVQIVDVSNPAQPVRAGTYKTGGRAQSLQVIGARAYIAEGTSGLEVVDVANVSSPKRVTLFPTDDQALALQIQDGFGYIADGNSGLMVVELGAKDILQYTASYPTAGNAADVKVADGYAYLADSEAGLQILDVRDPAHPVQVSNYFTSGDATSVQMVGHTAYIADYGLEIVDVTQPAAPEYLGGFFDFNSGIEDFVVQGTTAFLATYWEGLIIVDVTDPQNPESLGSYVEEDMFAYAVAVQGSYAYLGTSDEVQVIDIHDPTEPVKVGSWANAGFPYVVQVRGRYAYVGHSDGLSILDIGDPSHPRLVSALATVGAEQLQLDGDLLYLANSYDGFQVVDVSDVTRPTSLGTFRTIGNASSINVAGKNAYVACGEQGLQIFELHQAWPQTLTFSPPQEIAIHDPALTLTAIASSGLPISYSLVRGAATLEGDGLSASAPGEIVVRAVQAGDSRYLAAAVEKTIQVRLRAQRITWTSPASPLVTWNAPYPLSAQAESGLPVTYQLKSGPALLQKDTLTVTNLGAVVLEAHQAGNDEFAPSQQDLILNAPVFSARERGSWPGYARGQAYGVQVSGHYAYVAASTGGVVIFDISNPATPRRVGSIKLDSPVNDVRELRVVDNIAYVLNWTAGLFMVDVTDPALPVELGHISVGTIVWGLDVVDGLAYLSDYFALSIVDVRNPRSPELLGQCPVGVTPNSGGVAVRAGVAFVADGMDGLAMVDVHDPRHPLLLGQFSITGGAVDRISLVGPNAYVSQSYNGFTVVDISDPGAPRELGHYTSGQADDLQVVNGLAYVTGFEDVLQIVDVSDPAQPVRIGNLNVPGANVAGVAVVGAQAFVAARFSDLLVVDISNPHKPISAGTGQTDGSAADLDVVGNTVYVADSAIGLDIVDATDPAKPERLATFSQAGQGSGIVVSNELAYLGAWNRGLAVVNTKEPRNPVALSQLAVPGYAARPALNSNRILLPAGDKGLQLLDAADPAKLMLMGGLDFGDWTYAVAANGRVAFAGTRSGLQIVDISDPTHLLRIGALPTTSAVYDVAWVGSLAYLANGTNGLRIVDLSDPRNPSTVSSLPTGGTSQGVWVQDGLVYLADGANGLSVIDVRDPGSPVLIGHVPILGYSVRVRVSSDRIYVAAGSAGLKILDAQIAWPQSIKTTLPERLPLNTGPLRWNATASSGLPVSGTVISGPAKLNGQDLEFTGVGTVTLQFEQSGNDRFLPAAMQQRLEIVGQTSQAVVTAWIANNYPAVPQDQRALLADPDADGVPNVFECLLGTNPGVKDPLDGRLPPGHITLREGQLIWEIAPDLNAELASLLDWQFETTTALDQSTWQAVSLTHLERTATGTIIRLPVLGVAQFLRLQIRSL